MCNLLVFAYLFFNINCLLSTNKRDKRNTVDNGNIEFDVPDIFTDFTTATGSVTLEGFKVRQHAGQENQIQRWVSAGYPTLLRQHGSDSIFHCIPEYCTVLVQMLTDHQRLALVEAAKRQYHGRNISKESIQILPLSQLICELDIVIDDDTTVHFRGTVFDLSTNPLQLRFHISKSKRLFLFSRITNSTDLLTMQCTMCSFGKKSNVNALTITSHQLQSLNLIESLFGDIDNVYISHEQMSKLANEIASKLDIMETYEIEEEQFEEKFISEILKLSGSNWKHVELDEVLSKLSKYGLNMNERDLAPDEIKREMGSILEVRKLSDKERIVVNRENADKFSRSGTSSSSTAGGGSFFGFSAKAAVKSADTHSSDWATSSKSLDDQLKDINRDTLDSVNWTREGMKIVPKSFKVTKLTTSFLENSVTIKRIKKFIVDAKFSKKFELHMESQANGENALEKLQLKMELLFNEKLDMIERQIKSIHQNQTHQEQSIVQLIQQHLQVTSDLTNIRLATNNCITECRMCFQATSIPGANIRYMQDCNFLVNDLCTPWSRTAGYTQPYTVYDSDGPLEDPNGARTFGCHYFWKLECK